MINSLKVKKAVRKFLSAFKTPIYVPFDFSIIGEVYPNIAIIKYSEFQSRYEMSYNEVLDIFESDDAVCNYEIKTNKYIILYNDLDVVKMNCFRYRFSIAHELGHIFLGHLNDERSRIFRGSFSKKEYEELEEEADQFAAYILCPYAAFTDLEVLSVGRLSSICHLSKFASERRYAEYTEWFNNKTLTGAKSIKFDWFDILLRKKFAVKRYCQKCKRVMDFDNYCKICGDRLDLVPLIKEDNNMIYSNIEINENHKAVKCPQCENEHSV